MLTNDQKQIQHLTCLISYSFIFSPVAYLVSFMFLPDLSVDPPVIPGIFMTLMKIQTALIILASTAYGIKLTEEKKTLPSIGFTMMAIAQGVLYVVTTFTLNSNEKIDEAYRMLSAYLYLQVPAIIIISVYHNFPRWINVLAILSMVPLIIEFLVFQATEKLSMPILIIDTVGNLMLNVATAAWGVVILKRAKRKTYSLL